MLRPFLLFLAFLAVGGSAMAQQRSGLDLASIDRSVRPQDDLWRYANGRWLAATEIPPDRAAWDTFAALRDKTEAQLRDLIEGIDPATTNPERRKIADFYKAYMDSDAAERNGIGGLSAELDRIHRLSDKAELPALFGHLAIFWVRTPVFLDVSPDEHDATTYVPHLHQSGLGLPDRDYYLKDDVHFVSVRSAYHDHILQLLTMAGEPALETTAQAVIGLETELARLQWTRVQNRDPIKTYNRRALADLPAFGGADGWKSWMAALGVEGTPAEVVLVQPSYFEGLASLMRDTPIETWKAYLAYNLLSSYAPLLSARFVDENFSFEMNMLRGVPQQLPRWKRAVDSTGRLLAFAVGKLYVERHFPPANKAHAEALIANMRDVYRQRIETLDWMSPETRRQALDKLAAIRPKIGYPDKWRDYGALRIERGDLVGNVMRARQLDYAFWTAKVGKKVDRDEWFTAPQVVNAFYNPNQNEIIFPAAILQPPFFDASADDAANYGGIGVVIGHEISHAFDDQGSRFDGVGNLRNWWTAEDRARFEAKTKALVAQYDSFSPLPGYNVNGALTLGENVADNAGLAMAERAYHHSLAGKAPPMVDGFTGEQRLFIAFAQIWKDKVRDKARIERLKVDPHSPGQFRANGSVRNQPAFHDAFEVKPGDGMYLPPDKRESVW
ncbi:MAG TPA: M13 family metallopeptidase [Reyranella sp.]|nr:M13 family metallopeptidase [Reyranella sp.]